MNSFTIEPFSYLFDKKRLQTLTLKALISTYKFSRLISINFLKKKIVERISVKIKAHGPPIVIILQILISFSREMYCYS